MESLYLLIPLSLLLLLGGVGIYFWAVRSGQYDDLDGEGQRILFDDEPVVEPSPEADKATAEETADQSSEQTNTQSNKPQNDNPSL